MYKLTPPLYGKTEPVCVLRISDNTFIPFDEANTDYQEYLKWLAEGSEPLPAEDGTPEPTDGVTP